MHNFLVKILKLFSSRPSPRIFFNFTDFLSSIIKKRNDNYYTPSYTEKPSRRVIGQIVVIVIIASY